MILLKVIFGAAFITLVLMLFGIMVLVPLAAGTQGSAAGAAAGVIAIDPSADALADVPPLMLGIYVEAAATCPGLPWTVIAGIGKVESDHGRFGGAATDSEGNIRPKIIGPPLNGSAGVRSVVDTDDGILDNDLLWDHAVGPFQFIPTSWAIFGVDGNGDGAKDPHNVFDAIHGAVRHLCPNGEIIDVEAAIFNYNRSTSYVDRVLEWSLAYTGTVSAIPVAGYALPIGGLTEAQATRPHHDYPAIDIGIPVGTPTFAMVDGVVDVAIGNVGVYREGPTSKCGNTVAISGVDGVRYTYCHLSAVTVTTGQQVTAGQRVGLTGGQPGARGAGNTTAPHLHLSMRGQGRALCPQPAVLSIVRHSPINPIAAPSSGCVTGASIDWSNWLGGFVSDEIG